MQVIIKNTLELNLKTNRQLTHMKNILFLAFVLFVAKTNAQDTAIVIDSTAPAVIIYKDPRIDLLVKKQASINLTTKKSMARTGRGYRLLVINTNKREEAIAAKTRIYTLFPELKSYLAYQSPYFKLKAGNFKTRAEAERYQKNMSGLFPKGVFIMNDIIEIKPEKEEIEE